MKYFFFLLLFYSKVFYAQINSIDDPKNIFSGQLQNFPQNSLHKNNFKINILSPFIHNYSASFERLISKKISVQLGYRYAPYSYLIDNIIGKKIVKQGIGDPRYYGFETSNYAVTGDIRWYLGKKEGMRGLFIGLYGRFVVFSADNKDYNYVTKPENVYNVPLVTNFNGLAGGIIVGRQWIIKKRITIEYLSGFHYGKLNGSLTSKKDLSGLSDEEKNNLKANISEIFLIFDKNYLSNFMVTDDGINGNISGPFIGIRSAISIGLIF